MNTRMAGFAGALAGALTTAAGADLKEAFPHVFVDVEERVIEFSGTVPIFVHDEEAPDVYLEVMVCTPDTKEHETLVVTPAKPSHVHAALLMIGLNPGRPGWWSYEGEGVDTKTIAHDPEGDRVSVEFIWTDEGGVERTATPAQWVSHQVTGEPLPIDTFVFAGSRMLDRGFGGEMYDADGTGLLIGLATFGSETVAWPRTFSPDSGVDEPVWVANPKTTPPLNTAVRVRLRPAP